MTSLLALFIALGGATVYAAGTIGSSDIKKNAVRSKHIKAKNVMRSDIAPDAVNGSRIADGSVGAADLGANSVGGAEITNGSVSAAKLGVTPQWTDLQYAPGWGTFVEPEFTFGPLQCFKDPFGIVHFRGGAEQTQPTATSPIATLPEACRVFPAGSASSLYAEFPGIRFGSSGEHVGMMWVGVQGNSNILGSDSPLPGFGNTFGFTYDGAGIGAR